MGFLDKIFGKTFEEKVEILRKSFVGLDESRACTKSDSLELKRIQQEWEPSRKEMEKGNTSAVLSVLNEKYEKAVQSIEGALKRDAEVQSQLRKGISDTIVREPDLFRLILADDFMSKGKYEELACTLVKAHKAGSVSDEPLQKLVLYTKEGEGDKEVYVRDNRVQYADTIIVNKKGEVLFVVRNKNASFCPNGYCLAGGHIEATETPKEAALRELSEETGIVLTQADIEPCGEYIDENSHIYYFIAHSDVQPVCLQSEEQVQYEWVSMEDFDKKPLIMNLENNLRHILTQDALSENALVHYSNGEIKKGVEYLADIRGLLGYSAIVKGEDIFVFDDEDVIEKAKSNLVRKKVFITRGGKTYLTTVYVNPQGEIKKDTGKETEVEAKVDLSGVALDDEIEVETSTGTIASGKVTSIRWNARDGAFMVIESQSGKVYTVYSKGVKKVNRIKSTVKVGGQQPAQPTPQPAPQPKPTSGIEAWADELKKGANFKKFDSLGGSGSNYMTEFGGKKWVVKKERMGKDGHLASESRADFVYRAMGFDAPDSRVFAVEDKNDGSVCDCKTNEYVQYRSLSSLTGTQKTKAYEEIAKGFALDALLGNWDVIGSDGQNILVKPDGSVYRMDNGASFEYRARGSRKNGSDFLTSTSVVELDSMRTGYAASSETKAVYGTLTDNQVCDQIDELLKRKKELMQALSDCGASKEVTDAIERRLGYMAQWSKTRRVVVIDWNTVTDKNMPTRVSEEYFKDWDTFDFAVDEKHCSKAVLKKNILEMEERRMAGIERTARELGMTKGEYVKKLQDLIDAVATRFEAFSCTELSTFQAIVSDPNGRYKSAVELGNKGTGYSRNRAREEYERYGFPNDIKFDKSARMICGYLTNNNLGAFSAQGRNGNGIPPSADSYGPVMVRIKRDVALKRATFTCQNSLGTSWDAVAVPMAKPHYVALMGIDSGADKAKKVMEELEKFAKGKTYNIDIAARHYFEMQMHEGIKKDDIESVNLCRETMGVQGVNDAANFMVQHGFGKIRFIEKSDADI